jgi:hypothetical protein
MAASMRRMSFCSSPVRPMMFMALSVCSKSATSSMPGTSRHFDLLVYE